MILLVLSGMSLVASMAFAGIGEVWGWLLWWVLAIVLGAIWAIKEAEK